MKTKLFLSYASEDEDFAENLHAQLKAEFDVWFAPLRLVVGHSLLQEIGKGLRESDFGIVILSQSYFKKEWTRNELDGLVALEDETKKVVLPVWLGVQKSDVRQFSPVMAGRLASIASRGVDVVADDIRKSIQELKRAEELSPLHSFSDQLERLVELSTDFEEQKKLRSESGTGNRAEKAFNEFRRSTRDLFDAMKVKLPKLSLQWWQADEFNVRITAVDCFYLSFHCKEPLRANECVLHLKIGPMEMGESYPMSEWGSEMHFSPTIVAGVVSWVSPQEHATAPPQLAKGWMQKFLDYIQVNLENGRDTPSRDDD